MIKKGNIMSLYDFRQNLDPPPRPGKPPLPAQVNAPPLTVENDPE